MRVFGWLQVQSDMEYEASHDRALFAAGFVKAPFIAGVAAFSHDCDGRLQAGRP